MISGAVWRASARQTAPMGFPLAGGVGFPLAGGIEGGWGFRLGFPNLLPTTKCHFMTGVRN